MMRVCFLTIHNINAADTDSVAILCIAGVEMMTDNRHCPVWQLLQMHVILSVTERMQSLRSLCYSTDYRGNFAAMALRCAHHASSVCMSVLQQPIMRAAFTLNQVKWLLTSNSGLAVS